MEDLYIFILVLFCLHKRLSQAVTGLHGEESCLWDILLLHWSCLEL